MTYQIAEIFHSVQGEGFWTGTPMMFVRLAGCNVGRYEPKAEPDFIKRAISMGVSNDKLLVLEGKHSFCTSFDGQRFLCDTDYHSQMQMDVEQILAELQTEEHICITGGEPFLHDLGPLVTALQVNPHHTVHIETSGTKPVKLPNNIEARRLWITCCPKAGLLDEMYGIADEWKILVGPNFAENVFELFLSKLVKEHYDAPAVYFQPINGVEKVNQENLQRCLELLKNWPEFKLSAQCHKLWEVR